MKRLFTSLALWGLIVSCSGLPVVHPPGNADPGGRRSCRYPFPSGRWQLVHSIKAAFPRGGESVLIGVTILSSGDRSARCILMTLEGLVLFKARFNGKAIVERAIAPFDSEIFAGGLIRDIRLLFFKPQGAPVESGRLTDGAAICRYQLPDGGIIDMVSHGNSRWELNRYGPDLHLARTVEAAFRSGAGQMVGLPDRIHLKAHDSGGYSLVMDLVEAIPLDPESTGS